MRRAFLFALVLSGVISCNHSGNAISRSSAASYDGSDDADENTTDEPYQSAAYAFEEIARSNEFRNPRPPERDALVNKEVGYSASFLTRDDGIELYAIEGEYAGFQLYNNGSPRINPKGLKDSNVSRVFLFRFRDLARQGIYMMVEDYPTSDGDSNSSMFSSLYFFPRNVIPAVKIDQARNEAEVTLTTGEKVYFSTQTWEITRGVLREDAPMDYNPDRFKRRFAAITYTGKGVLIRIDQRGGMPEDEAPFGKKLKKFATITHGSRKPCQVAPAELWHQGHRSYNQFLFVTDEEFRQKILVGRCGWHDFKFEL